MKRRNWTSEQKFKIVLEGLKGNISISELCNQHQISQAQFYQWRDKLFKDGSKIFEHGGVDKEAERLKKQNQKLKGMVGELTMELKKSEEYEW